VLLVVTGLSPQVVTETVYALAVQRKPPWIPQEVRLVTTAEGAERARLTLMDRKTGWFHRLRREYGLPGIRFGEETLRVLKDREGKILPDIRTAEDNMAAADFLLREMLEVTGDAGTELHVSIAGGRKTMGFFAGYALSLCGRPQDVLSHVLVDAPFESHPGFFYPARERQVIHTAPPESRPLDASKARVTLAEIPFVRLRELLERAGGGAGAGFAEAVGAVQGQVSPILELDCAAGLVRAGAVEVRMKPAETAFYAMIARAAKEGRRIACPPGGEDLALAAAFLKEYRRCGRVQDAVRTEKALRKGMDREYFLERVSRVNRALREALGGVRSQPYEISRAGRRTEAEYVLGVQAGSIRFIGE
jgi:CRISPR-associated protein (TIGR02584 family)